MTRPLIVGQAPSFNSNAREPLSGKSGARLAALCGIPHEMFLAAFERVNLIDAYPGRRESGKGDKFDKAASRIAACNLTPRLARRKTVLLGRNVALAFYYYGPMFRFVDEIGDGALVALSPHPSAASHWWNVARHVSVAQRFWAALAQEALEQY